MQLSKRELDILLKFIESNDYISITEIADREHVSERSIKYDLNNIKSWLATKEIHLQSVRNKGMKLAITDKQRQAIRNELLETERVERILSQKDRINIIIYQLCMSDKVISMNDLADILQVSINTIVNDVEKTEDLLEKFKIKLERTPGQGMSINGAEKEIRMIMEYLANSYLTEYDIYSFTNQLLQLSDSVSPILLFDERSGLKDIYQTVITKVAKLNQQGQLKDYNYVDLLALVIKLTISVSRLKIGHSIGGFNLMPRDAQDNILILMEEIFSEYNFPIFKDEYRYLSNDLDHETVEDLLKLTDQIIQLVSQKMNLPFDLDEQLRINLNAHLTLSFSKKRIYVNEYNPYVKDVRELNPKLFNTVSRVCKQVFKSLNIPVTNSFVSYIVLHFLASIENQKQTTERIRAVYVCSTGLGVTTLIQRKIEEEISNIEIVCFSSVLDVYEVVKKEKPDLVISIFPLDYLPCEVIKVNALPSKEDIQNIKNTIRKIKKHSITNHSSRSFQPRRNIHLEELSKEIILNGYRLFEELKESDSLTIREGYEDALLLHILLLAHRIAFNHQYEDNQSVDVNKELLAREYVVRKIEELFSNNNLVINKMEIIALLQYIG